MRTTYRFVVTVLGAVTLAASVFLAPPAAAAPVSTDDLLNAKDNTRDWLQYSQTYDGHRYVRLNQINRSNVHRLRPAWIFPTGGENRGLEATPLIHDGVI